MVGLNHVYLMTQVLHRSSVPLTPEINFTNSFRAIVLQISEKNTKLHCKYRKAANTGGPRYIRSFYLQIHVYAIKNNPLIKPIP